MVYKFTHATKKLADGSPMIVNLPWWMLGPYMKSAEGPFTYIQLNTVQDKVLTVLETEDQITSLIKENSNGIEKR